MNAMMRAELTDLDRRFTIVTTPVDIYGGTVLLERPRDRDDLISEEEFAADDRLPYWADIWPASIILARFVASDVNDGVPTQAEGTRRAIELGCGLGLGTIAALRAGYDVTATDYYVDATLFAARNALTATGAEPTLRMVDWRDLPADLGTFDLVLAADVLYESAHAILVAETIHRTLAPGGRALLADQGRVALESFLVEATARGLSHRAVHCEERPTEPPAPEGSIVKAITIYELRHV